MLLFGLPIVPYSLAPNHFGVAITAQKRNLISASSPNPDAGDRMTLGRMYAVALDISIETEQKEDGRWLAEVSKLPGVIAYGDTEQHAQATAEALALRVLEERRKAFQM